MSSGLGGIECTPAETDKTFTELLRDDAELVTKLVIWLSKL